MGVKMTSAQTVAYLVRKIQQVRQIIADRGDLELVSADRRLSDLLGRLEALGPEFTPGLEEPLEVEFYRLVESTPKLRSAFLKAVDINLLAILSEKMRHYEDLAKSKAPDEAESKMALALESELAAIKARLNFGQSMPGSATPPTATT